MKGIIRKGIIILIPLIFLSQLAISYHYYNKNKVISHKYDEIVELEKTCGSKLEEYEISIAEKNNKITDLEKRVKSLTQERDKLKQKNTSLKKPTNSYRLTSFWSGDGYNTGSCTGTGLCEKHFQINDKGWYVYKGKLVLGAATKYLLKYGYKERSDIRYFKYFDELTINIEGVDYPAIVLDSCGACMKNQILDLFVSGSNYSITTNNVYIK